MRTYSDGIEVESDDQAVLACLAFHGHLPQMLAADQLADDKGHQFPRSFTGWTAGGKMYVAAHFRNYSDAQDNGYALLIIDLAVWPLEQAAQIAGVWCHHGRDTTGPWAFDVVNNPPAEVN